MIRNRLSVLLAERSLTGTQLSKDTGIAQSSVSKIASNKTKSIDFEILDKICIYLGIEPKDFFVYAPYNWKVFTKEGYWNEQDNCCTFLFHLKTPQKENNILLNVWYRSVSSIDFPSDSTKYTVWAIVSVDNERNGAKDKDFYNFVLSLPLSLQAQFYEDITALLQREIFKSGSTILIEDYDFNKEKISLKKSDKVYVSFFENVQSENAPSEIKRDTTFKVV